MFSININTILKSCSLSFYCLIIVEQAIYLPSVNVLFYLRFIPNSRVTMCNTNHHINLSAWTSYAATINILPDRKEYFLLLIKWHWIPISSTSFTNIHPCISCLIKSLRLIVHIHSDLDLHSKNGGFCFMRYIIYIITQSCLIKHKPKILMYMNLLQYLKRPNLFAKSSEQAKSWKWSTDVHVLI